MAPIPPEKEATATVPITVYRLTGLTCADCAAQFEQKLKNYPGVIDARVNFGAAKVTITGNPVPPAVVNELGAFDNIRVEENAEKDWWLDPVALLTAISGLFVVAAYAADVLGAARPVVAVLYALAILTGGWRTGRLGFGNLLRLEFDMNTLMAVAVTGAILIGYWEEAAVVAFLFGVSETLEEYSIEKARQSLRSLLELAPQQARVIREGREQIVPVDLIRVGDVMVVRPGEKIAMDGIIQQGSSFINEAAITGESLPVAKGSGDEVFAGTVNGEGTLRVLVTKLVQDTTLAKIIALVEAAQEQKAPSQAFVDRFARYYTPMVMVIATLVALVPPLLLAADWRQWLYQSLALLIVACPCALVVSTPVAIVTAIGNAARNGVLIKGGIHLENLGGIRVVAFDKTGTLTEGRSRVAAVELAGDASGGHRPVDREWLAVLAGIENESEHPLATAIVAEITAQGIEPAAVQDFQAIPGKGARAVYRGETYYAGSPRLFEELGADLEPVRDIVDRHYRQGNTVVLFGTPDEIKVVVALSDTIRPHSRTTIQRLKELGLAKTVMLTGDNPASAREVAAAVGLDEFRAGLLPHEKLQALEDLQRDHGRVAMVGDGINDAPALAAATTGIAMGGAGTDTAMETADIVLMADDLSKLPYSIALSRRALRIIKQNIAFSILIKALAFLLIFPGWLTLWLAILSDMGATVLVVLNSLRLLRKST